MVCDHGVRDLPSASSRLRSWRTDWVRVRRPCDRSVSPGRGAGLLTPLSEDRADGGPAEQRLNQPFLPHTVLLLRGFVARTCAGEGAFRHSVFRHKRRSLLRRLHGGTRQNVSPAPWASLSPASAALTLTIRRPGNDLQTQLTQSCRARSASSQSVSSGVMSPTSRLADLRSSCPTFPVTHSGLPGIRMETSSGALTLPTTDTPRVPKIHVHPTCQHPSPHFSIPQPDPTAGCGSSVLGVLCVCVGAGAE